MALQQAEDFVIKAQSKIAKLKEQQGKGSVDEQLEAALKQNKLLQKTMRSMHEMINDIFEKHDPMKVP